MASHDKNMFSLQQVSSLRNLDFLLWFRGFVFFSCNSILIYEVNHQFVYLPYLLCYPATSQLFSTQHSLSFSLSFSCAHTHTLTLKGQIRATITQPGLFLNRKRKPKHSATGKTGSSQEAWVSAEHRTLCCEAAAPSTALPTRQITCIWFSDKHACILKLQTGHPATLKLRKRGR